MDIKLIADNCRKWRVLDTEYTQKQIAEELGVSVETISAFEHGRTNNAVVLSWYIEHGFTL